MSDGGNLSVQGSAAPSTPQSPCSERQPDCARSQPTKAEQYDTYIPDWAVVVPEAEVQTVKAIVYPPLDPIEAMNARRQLS